MLIKPHWNLYYLTHRIPTTLDRLLHPDVPWIPKPGRKWLEKNLHKDMNGIEWGSGRSTIWLAKRIRSLVSVEESRKWYERLSREIQKQGLVNVRYHYAGSNAYEASFSKEILEGYKEDYIFVERNLEPETLDFAFIDGCFRGECMFRAVGLLKYGGFLILDDSNCYLPTSSNVPVFYTDIKDQLWIQVKNKISNWDVLVFCDGVKEMKIWIRSRNT